MKVKNFRLSRAYGGAWELIAEVSPESVKEAMNLCDKQKDTDYEADIKVYREKRSLTANAYAWKLMSEIGKAVKPPLKNEEVYEMMLRWYAPVTLVSVKNGVDLKSYGLHAEMSADLGDMTEWRVYKGSSEYDSKEMSVFLDGIKYEAEMLGIETLPPDELRRLYAQVDNSM